MGDSSDGVLAAARFFTMREKLPIAQLRSNWAW